MTARDSLEIFLLSAIWGASFILIKFAGESFPPSWVALMRLFFGTVVLWIALLARKRGLSSPSLASPSLAAPSLASRSLLLPLLVVAALNNAIPFTLIAWGERSVPSSIAAVLNATTTLWGLLFALILRHDHHTHRVTAGVFLGFAGVAMVVSAGEQYGDIKWLGVILVALGAMSYAVATAIAKSKLKGFDPLSLATAQLSIALLLIAPVALLGPHPVNVTTKAIVAVSLLGIFGTGLAYLLFYGLLARISGIQVQAVTYVLPVWGLVWGVLDGEPVGKLSIAGVGVVLAGLALLSGPAKVR